MAKSKKPAVIEHIFDQLFDPASGTLIRTVVTAEDLENAKRFCNEKLGLEIRLNSNPFNFMKDIVRSNSGTRIWPERIRQLGFRGEQCTGDGNIFEFVSIAVGDDADDPLDFRPTDDTNSYFIQSLSLPIASKTLGRTDESWLLQVAVNLRVIESHFAIGENKQIDALELNHLQMDIKLRKVQIDALYLARCAPSDSDTSGSVLITVEAKQGDQRVLIEQIARQVRAAFQSTENDRIIPTAIVAIRGKGMYVVEFKAVHRSELENFDLPKFHRDAIFILTPSVQGI